MTAAPFARQVRCSRYEQTPRPLPALTNGREGTGAGVGGSGPKAGPGAPGKRRSQWVKVNQLTLTKSDVLPEKTR